MKPPAVVSTILSPFKTKSFPISNVKSVVVVRPALFILILLTYPSSCSVIEAVSPVAILPFVKTALRVPTDPLPAITSTQVIELVPLVYVFGVNVVVKGVDASVKLISPCFIDVVVVFEPPSSLNTTEPL